MKKIFISVLVVAVLVIGLASVAFAAGVLQTPAEIVAGLTGQPVDAVLAARNDGTAYGAQAAAAGKLDEFQAARLEQYRLRLDEAVASGQLTQERADEYYEAMADRLADCDGSGAGFGRGSAQGFRGAGCNGECLADGSGLGSGRGRGMMGGWYSAD